MEKGTFEKRDVRIFAFLLFTSIVVPASLAGIIIYVYLWFFNLRILPMKFQARDPYLGVYAIIIALTGAGICIAYIAKKISSLTAELYQHVEKKFPGERIILLYKRTINLVPDFLFLSVIAWTLLDLTISITYVFLGQNFVALIRTFIISTLLGISLTVIPAYFFLDFTIKKYARIFFKGMNLREYSDIHIVPVGLKILSAFSIGGVIPALILFLTSYDFKTLIASGIVITPEIAAKFSVVTIAALAISIAMAVTSAYYFSKTIAVPLKKLDSIMTNIDAGDLNICLKPEYTDEIGHINQGLNNMIARVRDSVKYREDLLLMEKELDIAEKVQCSVLTQPEIYKSIKEYSINVIYRPQNGRVGGDYFNILKVDDYISIFLADATGHGIQAALATMQIDMINRQSLHLKDPGKRLSFLNDYYTHEIKGSTFFTACIVNLFSDHMLFGGAGHPEQLLINSSHELTPIKSTGKLLGAFPDIAWSTASLTIRPGDTLFLFTDGAFEQFNSRGVMCGEELLNEKILKHLKESKSISGCNKSIFKEIKEFTGDYGLNDDITVIAIRKL